MGAAAGAAALGVAGGAAGDTAGAGAAGAAGDAAAVWTPPWWLHAPFPVAVEVVPSLQVVAAGAVSAAAGKATAASKHEAAMLHKYLVFIDRCSVVDTAQLRIVARLPRIPTRTASGRRRAAPRPDANASRWAAVRRAARARAADVRPAKCCAPS